MLSFRTHALPGEEHVSNHALPCHHNHIRAICIDVVSYRLFIDYPRKPSYRACKSK